MAIVTRLLVELPTEFGNIDVSLEYDNALLRATGVLCHNPSPNNVSVTVARDSDGKTYSKVFGPGDSRIDIPTGAANRITLTFNERGGLDGYSFTSAYPV